MLVLFKAPPKPAKQTNGESVEAKHKSKLGELIGSSAPMREVLDMIRLVADSSATVLIQGESGTGKELVAKTIHRISYRRDKAFVVVDCGSLPETLLESELFGHVKGAFTGAHASKRGLFEEADGGTIFLDEIADTTATFQAKLLRVLQEGEVKPVGGTQPIKIDARVISATNKDLTELVKAKAFRQDLYYRLAVLPLYLPPLRERREDISLLVEHFIAESCKRHHQPIRTISPEVMQALTDTSWPGNVRELQHYIERAIVTTTGPLLACKILWRSTPWPRMGACDRRHVEPSLKLNVSVSLTPSRRPVEIDHKRPSCSRSAGPVSITSCTVITSTSSSFVLLCPNSPFLPSKILDRLTR